MRYTWERAFAEGRKAALVGEGPERALDACDRLRFDDSDPEILLEAPLIGAPSYDFLVTIVGSEMYPGRRLRDASQLSAQAAVDLIGSLEGPKANLFLELDAAGSGTLTGIYCKIEGRLDLAADFYRTIGEPQLARPYAQVAQRLPEGWLCMHAAAFPGRATEAGRMEIMVVGEKARASMADTGYLARCFDQVGFTAYSEQMLEDAARLAEVGTPLTLQFDILPEGQLGPVFSLVSYYEGMRNGYRQAFEPSGSLSRTCRIYEEMGAADGRWRLLEQACFTDTRKLLAPNWQVIEQDKRCLPCCTKVKWNGGTNAQAKFYLTMGIRTRM